MSLTLSRYLRLRIDSNLTANAKYNLERLDLLGSTFIVDTSSDLNIRSESDIFIEPQSADIGGSGIGGGVGIGSASHEIDSFSVHATTVQFSSPIGILDAGAGGSKYLRLRYQSDLNGSTDTTADRLLSLDLNGANRSLILGGNFSLLGASLSLTLTSPLSLTLPDDYGTSGQILSTDGMGGLLWEDNTAGTGDVSKYSTSWAPGDGTTKAVTHSLNSTKLEVAIYDENSELILVGTAAIVDSNSITLTSSEAPSSSWTVVVQA